MDLVAERVKHTGAKANAARRSAEPLPSASPAHPALELQQAAGNQAVQELLRSGTIRAKLAISQPDDPEEREADAVADHIMRFPAGAGTAACTCAHGGEM